MQQECDKRICKYGTADCGNRALQRRQWKDVEPFNTGTIRGFGLRCKEPLAQGDIVLEMCGEVYTIAEFGDRVSCYLHFMFCLSRTSHAVQKTRHHVCAGFNTCMQSRQRFHFGRAGLRIGGALPQSQLQSQLPTAGASDCKCVNLLHLHASILLCVSCEMCILL